MSILSGEDRELRAEVAALRLREEQRDAALAAWGVGTFRWEIGADLVTGDAGMERICAMPEGLPAKGLAGFLALVHEDDRARVARELEEALTGERVLETEFRILGGDGALRRVAARSRPLLDSNGRPAALIGACMDITARRRVEERLRESEERYRTLIETSPDAIFVLQDHRVVLANRQCARLLGAAGPEALVGMPALDLVAPAYRDLARRRIASTDRPGMRNEAVDFVVRHLDGGTVQVEATSSGVLLDGRLALQVALRDVTCRRAHEALQARLLGELDAERARLRAILEHMPAGLVIREAPGGALVLKNEQVRLIWRMAGAVPDERGDGAHMPGFHPDGRAYTPAEWPLMRAIEKGETVLGEEIEILRGDGTRGVISVNAAPVTDGQGRRIAGVGMFDDITRRREVERHQRLLLAELNHRVKNTLAVVRSIARQSLAGDRDPVAARQALENRLRALAKTHDLLTASAWQGVGLETLVRGELQPHGDRVQLDGAPVLLGPRATQTVAMVLHELATNAAKYGALSTPGGTVAVSWSIDDGAVLRLRWRELGGPPVLPPTRRGFGRILIERALAHELGGGATLRFAPQGVICDLHARLPDPKA